MSANSNDGEMSVCLSIETRTAEEVAHAFEVLARVAAGLTTGGIESRIYSVRHDEDDDG